MPVEEGPEELKIAVDGLNLAAQRWPGPGPNVLALHGWLDNAGSFARLAPLLPEADLVALDLPGHGRSDPRPTGAFYHFIDWIPDVVAVLDGLGWDRCTLVGHSMGAGIAPLVAATVPERVERLVMIDGLGPLTSPAEDAVQLLRRSLEAEKVTAPPLYANLEQAVERLVARGLSPQGALCVARRGTREVQGGVVFGHDPRLRYPSRARLTEPQIQAFFRAVQAPSLLIVASSGLKRWLKTWEERVALLAAVQVVELEAGHHLHLDNPELVAPPLRAFLGLPRPD